MEAEKVMNKSLKIIKFIFSIGLLYLVLFLIYNYVPFISRYDHMVVVSDSMTPTINVNDVVFIDTKSNHSIIEKDDIYAFYVDINEDGSEEIVIHYIDEVIENNGNSTYKTRPEVSDDQDTWTLQERDLIGAYKIRIPKVGKLLLFLGSWIGKVVIILDIIVIYFFVGALKEPDKDVDNVFSDDLDKYNK